MNSDKVKTIRLGRFGILALAGVILALFVPLFLILFVFIAAWRFIYGVVLRVWIWRAHAAHGRRVLFVYSDSPNWQTYIEGHILPILGDRAVVLNWSQRRLWPSTSPWEARFFHHFAGDREFNPLALVFRPGGHIRPVRFYRPFLDFKHGKDSALKEAEAQLIALLDATYPKGSEGRVSTL